MLQRVDDLSPDLSSFRLLAHIPVACGYNDLPWLGSRILLFNIKKHSFLYSLLSIPNSNFNTYVNPGSRGLHKKIVLRLDSDHPLWTAGEPSLPERLNHHLKKFEISDLRFPI